MKPTTLLIGGLVATNPLREPSNSSIVPSEGQLFIRAHKTHWRLANDK